MGVTISGIPTAATAPKNADLIEIEQGGTSKKLTFATFGPLMMRGRKNELLVSYVSSDSLSVSAGFVHVNDGTDDWWVQKGSATTINSSTTNFPAAGAWAFILIDSAGTISLVAATGAASVRPSDSCFQRASFISTGKLGYYYSATQRIIGAIHKVSSTSFYLINLGDFDDEMGENSNGKWHKFSNGDIELRGTISVAAGAWTGGPWTTSPFYRSFTATFPIPFTATSQIDSVVFSTSETNTITYTYPGYYTNPTVNSTILYIFNSVNATSAVIVISWRVAGKWK